MKLKKMFWHRGFLGRLRFLRSSFVALVSSFLPFFNLASPLSLIELGFSHPYHFWFDLFSFCLLLQVDLVAIVSSFVILIAGAPSLPNSLPLVLTALLRVLQICRMFRQEILQIPTHWRKVKMLQDRQTWGDMADGCPSGSLPLEGVFYSKL